MPDDLRDTLRPNQRRARATGEEEAPFVIDPAAVALPETAQREPSLEAAPVMVGFDDDPQREAESADSEPPLLDLARAVDEPEPRTTTQSRRDWIVDLGAAAGVHFLSLLVFMYWTAAPAEIAAPIPVQLVLEEPAAKPRPKPEAKPPPGRLASIAMGDPTAKPAKPTAEPPPDRPTKVPAAPMMPSPRQPTNQPELVSALPKPAPSMPQLKLPGPVMAPARETTAAMTPPVRNAAAVRPTTSPPRPERPRGRAPGPAATEDEYLTYANALIRRNQEMIPRSLLEGRNGSAVINILVLADGTIARIAIKQSSGYSEIDSRAERMVAAVKRFPPLPHWFRADSITLSYHMIFGDRMVLP